jgi:hypothetical protein
VNLPWFLNLPLDECIDQHTPQILLEKEYKKKKEEKKLIQVTENQSKAKNKVT